MPWVIEKCKGLLKTCKGLLKTCKGLLKTCKGLLKTCKGLLKTLRGYKNMTYLLRTWACFILSCVLCDKTQPIAKILWSLIFNGICCDRRKKFMRRIYLSIRNCARSFQVKMFFIYLFIYCFLFIVYFLINNKERLDLERYACNTFLWINLDYLFCFKTIDWLISTEH